ncbi:hypothetical protein C8R44DRAFT_747179 [Mycena epipterygia]|nr:hypothetical protein C8R44DRAFT_747179 [Mycena epipterygia]
MNNEFTEDKRVDWPAANGRTTGYQNEMDIREYSTGELGHRGVVERSYTSHRQERPHAAAIFGMVTHWRVGRSPQWSRAGEPRQELSSHDSDELEKTRLASIKPRIADADTKTSAITSDSDPRLPVAKAAREGGQDPPKDLGHRRQSRGHRRAARART